MARAGSGPEGPSVAADPPDRDGAAAEDRLDRRAASPRSQPASGEGIGSPGWMKLRKGDVTR